MFGYHLADQIGIEHFWFSVKKKLCTKFGFSLKKITDYDYIRDLSDYSNTL